MLYLTSYLTEWGLEWDYQLYMGWCKGLLLLIGFTMEWQLPDSRVIWLFCLMFDRVPIIRHIACWWVLWFKELTNCSVILTSSTRVLDRTKVDRLLIGPVTVNAYLWIEQEHLSWFWLDATCNCLLFDVSGLVL